ncbi:MAG: ribonuclease HII [Treponema sp.]
MALFCGIDEAGRGALAGPVSAAAVILLSDFPIHILNDSKKMSPKKRFAAETVIKESACWGVGFASHTEIDKINILQASLLAMKRAFEDMADRLEAWTAAYGLDGAEITAMTDGIFTPDIACAEVLCEPKADARYPAVMAASILAKTARDHLMTELDSQYPDYGYAGHKGYPTPEHIKICRRIGVSPIQRLSFRY